MDILKVFQRIFWTHVGTPEARSILKNARKRQRNLKKQIDLIEQRWPEVSGKDISSKYVSNRIDCNPVFVLSAGWRSGSTLVQRLLMSSGEIFIWGEPYGSASIIESLARPLLVFDENRPTKSEIWDGRSNLVELSNKWIANLSPHPLVLKESMCEFLETLFYAPLQNKGIPRWGLKEVRIPADYCFFLKWLYPRAKFVLVYRNPYHAWHSYRRYRRWFRAIPNDPVFTPYAFGRVWKNLVNSFTLNHDKIRAFLVSYESIVSDPEGIVRKMEEYLGFSISLDPLRTKVGGSRKKRLSKSDRLLLFYEWMWVRVAVGGVAARLGYNIPKFP